LGLALAATVGLAASPAEWTAPLRSRVASILKPGQRVALSLRQRTRWATAQVKAHFGSAVELADARNELQRLSQENRRLTSALTGAHAEIQRRSEAAADDTDHLLQARCLPARVMGRQAKAFLGRHRLLDVGSGDGVQPGALVVDYPEVIDRGGDDQLQSGQLVLQGSRVWGQIAELGPAASVVRTVAEAGYRDVVAVGRPNGPQGVLEGTGEKLAKIRLVPATEPVAVGDPVFAVATKGVLPVTPLYGHVVRAERPSEAAHWQIWIQPAVRAEEPERVGVLRVELVGGRQ